MIWGAFSSSGYTPLVRLQGRQDAHAYIAVLQTTLLPIIHNLIDARGFLLHDNAPIHKAGIVTQFLADNRINTLPWPPNSPDLNCIENIWAAMKRSVSRCDISDEEQLFQRLQVSWTNLLRT